MGMLAHLETVGRSLVTHDQSLLARLGIGELFLQADDVVFQVGQRLVDLAVLMFDDLDPLADLAAILRRDRRRRADLARVRIDPAGQGERLDRVENFHGNQVVYVGWDHHLMFCAPVAFAIPPDTPFKTVLEELIPGAFSMHPEFSEVDWDKARWHLNGEDFVPQVDVALIEQGVDHKSIIRFNTPGLEGIKGCGS